MTAFALRETDPAKMIKHPEPVGPENDQWLRLKTREAAQVVVAWGDGGLHRARAAWVVKHLLHDVPLWSLSQNTSGQPIHPLYVRADKRLTRWRFAA